MSATNDNRGGAVLGERFAQVLAFAAQTHRNQRRKGSDVPYIGHLLGVCSLVIEEGGREDDAIAALLHDAVEDQGGAATLEEIRAQFGDAVADVVLACSDTTEEPKPPWRQRKEGYLAHPRRTADLRTARFVSRQTLQCASDPQRFTGEW